MDRRRYSADWNEIAFQIKEAAKWHCQNCGRPCRMPGEGMSDFEERVRTWPDAYEHLPSEESANLIAVFKAGRFVLTVAHLDQRPRNNSPENLRALCPGCHLRHDAPLAAANRRRKQERAGQLNLLEVGNG